MDAMDADDNLSDASLIEDDDEEEELIIQTSEQEYDEDDGSENEDDQSIGEFHGFIDAEIEEQRQTVDANRPIFEGAMEGGYEYYEFDLCKEFPPDLNNCTGWFDGNIPDYKVKFCNGPPPSGSSTTAAISTSAKKESIAPVPQQKMENTLQQQQQQQQQLEETRKVMPLKIKRAQISGSITTPSPLLQRESREWKPSSQFFKPLSSGWVREVIYDKKEDGSLCPKAKEVVYHAPMQSGTKPRTFKSQAELKPFLANSPTLTLHNFSFRQDPLNAPKGQEVVHAIDEAVEIFPPKFESMEKMVASKPIIPKEKPIIPKEVMEPAPVTKTPERQKIISDSTSLSPSLPSGLLKVKMFGKMKEKNAFESSPGGTSHSSEQHNNDDSMEIDDDEDFDLETPNRTQSLGNSGVTITPISHLNKSKRSPSMGGGGSSGSSGANIHLPGNFELTKKAKISSQMKPKKPVLRPPIQTPITCSIHCKNASGLSMGYPELNCVSCQSMYHPICVGLTNADYSAYDFYCSTCQPPAGKENKPFTLGSTTITSALGPSTAKAKAMPSVTLTPTGGSGNRNVKKRPAIGKGATPLRPIEAQSVVNIAGMKYLVVPHPDPDVIKSKKKNNGVPGKLPIVLKPQGSVADDCPSFEVEETSEGKLTLLPIGPSTGVSKLPFFKKKNYDFTFFQSTLSAGYFAMLHVFRYLNTKDRLNASKVCRLWHQISRHPSLWTNITLKNCRINDWKILRDQFNRNGTQKLDLKKIIFVKTEEETWDNFAKDLVSSVTSLNAIELPKLSTVSLHSIVQSAIDSPITRLTCLTASNISFNDEMLEPVDLVHIGQLKELKELKLKSNSGNLIIDDFSQSLQEFVSFKPNMTNLALLSLQSLQMEHLQTIGQLKTLQSLELGNCDHIEPDSLFGSIQTFTHLKYLRLERGKFNDSIGELCNLNKLQTLELIDFEMVQGFGTGLVQLQKLRKFLLIPIYKDEVAAINAEAMDAFLSLPNLTHFYFGLVTEWLNSMNALMSKDSALSKDSFPILVNQVVEMYTLSKLYKTLNTALPNAQRVKILKMPKSATKKQYIATMK